KKYLALALLLCTLLSLTNSEDKHTLTFFMGSRWRANCWDCTCTRCCRALVCATPQWFPDDCVSVFDPEACEYVVHKKDDPTIRCPVFSAVLK
uniref:Beta-microseminoprotein n=1 Tax=Oreochromis aureus TaxID=47969 RepID=A0A668VYN2_OREAU